jgi:hypothetical protein
MKWEIAHFVIQTKTGRLAVEGLSNGVLGIWPQGPVCYSVTHLRSGQRIGDICMTMLDAIRFAEQIAQLDVWRQPWPPEIPVSIDLNRFVFEARLKALNGAAALS